MVPYNKLHVRNWVRLGVMATSTTGYEKEHEILW